MDNALIHFKLLLPAVVRLDVEIISLNIEAIDGARTFLPRHQDFFTALPAGILSYRTPDHVEHFVAIDHGLLLKCFREITLTSHQAIVSSTLTDLRSLVHEQFVNVDEQQRLARVALARLEAGAIRKFINLEHLHHG